MSCKRLARPLAQSLVLFAILATSAEAFSLQDSPTGNSASADQTHAWIVGRLWNGTDDAVTDAVLVVRDGKIVAAGSRNSVSIPAGAVVHDHSSAVMIPGLVIAETSIGQLAPDEQAVTPQFRAVDGVDLFADHTRLLSAGITTVHVNPGTQRLIPGQSAVMKLFGDFDQRVLRETESMQVILSAAAWNPPTVYEPPVGANAEVRPIEPTRPQLASSLAEAVSGIRALLDSSRLELPASTSGQDREILGAIAKTTDGKMPVRITARSAAEISAAARLVADYKLNAILVNPEFLNTVAKRTGDLAQQLPFTGFVLVPTSVVGNIRDVSIPDEDARRPDEIWATARLLAENSLLDHAAIGGLSNSELEDVMLQAGLLKRGSIGTSQILKMLTANAATILGVADRVGSLEPGKDADFVILSADPFERGSTVLATHVSGQPAFESANVPAKKTRAHIVRAGSIYTPHGIIANGSLVVSGGQIAAVGTDVSLPADAEVHDFSGAVIVPGIIDLNSQLGFGAALAEQVQLNGTLANQLVSEDKTVQFVRQSGITTALVGSSRMPTPVMAFKLSDRPRAIRDPVALRFDLNGNLTSVETSIRRSVSQGKAYDDGWKKYEAQFAEYETALKAYEAEMKKIADAEAKAKAEADAKAAEEAAKKAAEESRDKPAGEEPADKPEGEKPATAAQQPEGDKPAEEPPEKPAGSGDEPPAETKPDDAGGDAGKPAGPQKPAEPEKPRKVDNLEPWREVFAGKLPVIAVASQTRAIELAVKIFVDEFSLPVIIAGAEDADLATGTLKNPKVSVALGPQMSVRRDNTQVNLPQQLATAGIPFGFQSGAASGSSLLPAAISAATWRGLGPGDALKATSASPAEFLQLGSIGKLAAGHDADLVVLSGPPFDLGTEVLAVMIDGQWVYEKDQTDRQESK